MESRAIAADGMQVFSFFPAQAGRENFECKEFQLVQYKTFKLGLTETSSERLNSFLRQNTVVAIERQFVPAGAVSFFAVLVEYDAQSPATKYDRSDKVDYAKILTEQQFLCFNELREYRNKSAKEQGIPAYVAFTNEMASQMAQLSEQTKSALAKIEGFGESKMKKYGDSILAILTKHARRDAASEANR